MMSIYRRVLIYYRPFSQPTLLALGISLVTIGLNLLKPWPFGVIVDRVLPSPASGIIGRTPPAAMNPAHEVFALCAFLVFITLASGLLGLWSNFLFVRVGLQALLKLRTDLFAYLQSLPLKYHDARRSSDSSFRVAYDSQSVQTIYNRGFTNIVSSGITLVGIFVIMLRLDWALTLLSVAIVPAVVWAIQHFSRRVRQQSISIQEKESAVLTLAQEGLSSIRVVHAFGGEQAAVNQFRAQAGESLAANLQLTMTNVKSALVINTLMALGTAGMIYLGTLHVLDGRLTLGDLYVFMSYLAMLYAPIEALTQTAWALEGATAGAQRCFEVLDHADDVRDAPGAAVITGENARQHPLRGRGVRLRPEPSHSARDQPRLAPRRARGVCRGHRSRQKHVAFPGAKVLRSRRRTRAARRTRSAGHHQEIAPRRDQPRLAGHPPFLRDGPGKTLLMAAWTPRRTRSPRRRNARRPMNLSANCRAATTAPSANAAVT